MIYTAIPHLNARFIELGVTNTNTPAAPAVPAAVSTPPPDIQENA